MLKDRKIFSVFYSRSFLMEVEFSEMDFMNWKLFSF